MKSLLSIVALGVLAVSCGQLDPLIGVYRPHFDANRTVVEQRAKRMGAPVSEVEANMREAAKTDMILELRRDHTYYMGAPGKGSIYLEGTWSKKDETLTLTPSKVFDGPRGEVKQLDELKTPLTARVEDKKLLVGAPGLEMVWEKASKP
jgi:hypothetical protein